jgi:menaquinol-cytochrome c reductase iron-sulfur subunit
MSAGTSKTTPPEQPPDENEISRRKFFERVSIVLGGVVTLGLVVPAAGFILEPLFRRVQQVWRPVGKASTFKVGETVAVRFEDSAALKWAGVTARTAAWLRRESEDKFVAFAINCTHLGCPVRWMPAAELFLCPCHGGVYYKDGTVAAGPPPKPLTRYPVRVNEKGDVEIQTGPTPITD